MTSFFVSVNIYIYIYINTHTYIHTYIHTHKYIYKYMYTYMCINSTNEIMLNTPSNELGNYINRAINRLPRSVALPFNCDKIEVYDLCC